MIRNRKPLDGLVASGELWKQRICCDLYFIRRGDFDDTIRIAAMLLHHEHDLIHKAVGWMLREIGKRDDARLESFLEKHLVDAAYDIAARSKMPAQKRQQYRKNRLKRGRYIRRFAPDIAQSVVARACVKWTVEPTLRYGTSMKISRFPRS
ncbi:MAG: DNA alkylation repair protein [Polyangiales bacterium]